MQRLRGTGAYLARDVVVGQRRARRKHSANPRDKVARDVGRKRSQLEVSVRIHEPSREDTLQLDQLVVRLMYALELVVRARDGDNSACLHNNATAAKPIVGGGES